MKTSFRSCTVLFLALFCTLLSSARTENKPDWYFSWGYNGELWLPSNIQVTQSALGNNFLLKNVAAHDEPGWNTGIFNKPISDPQYNIKIGCFFNKLHTKGLELSFDHTKYTVTNNQASHITGVVNGAPVNEDVILTSSYFSYVLHNGANHLMLSYVQRKPLIGQIDHPLSLQGFLKTGGGIMLPHSENTIMGNSNGADVGPKDPSNWVGIEKGWWRYGGYTAGAECGVRFAPIKWVFMELSGKVAYANISEIPVFDGGMARQELWILEGILSIGASW